MTILGKKHFGNKAHGLVHCVYELYGPKYAGDLLSIMCRLFIVFLQIRGFTCGIDDLLIDEVSEVCCSTVTYGAILTLPFLDQAFRNFEPISSNRFGTSCFVCQGHSRCQES